MSTLGKYEVLFPLSVPGSTVQTYLATQKGFGGFRKLVILREVLQELQGSEEANQAFMKEVKSVAAFHHPNVAEVYDLEAADGRLLLATEFVPGATLEEIAAAFRVSKLRIPLGLVLTTVRDTALALQYAHTFTNPVGRAEPVVHGALSPRTVQVTFEGLTKVLDFGAPKPPSSAPHAPAVDLAALGALVPAVLAEKAADVSLSTRPDLTGDLRAVLARLIAADPQQRFTTASDFVKALEAAATPVLWRPEQIAGLVQRMFGERREEIRQLLAQLADPGSSTASMPLSKIFSEGRAPPESDPPTLPPQRREASRPPVADMTDPDGEVAPPEPGDATNPRAESPVHPMGQPSWQVATVIKPSGEKRPPENDRDDDRDDKTEIRRSGERPMPPSLGDEPDPSTDVRIPPQPRPPRAASGGRRILRIFFVLVLVGIGLVVLKWRMDPAWIRVRAPKLAEGLEKLVFIPGFPGPEAPRNEQEVLALLADSGTMESPAPTQDGGTDAGLSAAARAGSDAGRPDAGTAEDTKGKKKHHRPH